MRVRLKSAAAALLALAPFATYAVSLAEWTPRAVGLPPACQAVYTAPIAGCNVKDFESGQCSQRCIAALEALEGPVKRACAGKGVTGRNLIVAFLANVGPQQICPNAPPATPFAPPYPPGMHHPTISASSSQWQHPPAPSASGSWSGTSTASSLTLGDSSSLVVDTSSTPKHNSVPPTTKTPSTTSTPTSSAPSQLNTGDGSGGGSPFDTMGNLGSGAAVLSFPSLVGVLLSGVVAVFALR